jgi:lipoprotein NlpI
MRKDVITSVLAFVSIVFVALGIFYIQEGSFEGAGARMDSVLTDLPENAARTADETAETANDVIEDIADGPDD